MVEFWTEKSWSQREGMVIPAIIFFIHTLEYPKWLNFDTKTHHIIFWSVKNCLMQKKKKLKFLMGNFWKKFIL